MKDTPLDPRWRNFRRRSIIAKEHMLTLWQTTHLNSELFFCLFFFRKLRRWKSLNLTEVPEVTPLANAASFKINVGAWYNHVTKCNIQLLWRKANYTWLSCCLQHWNGHTCISLWYNGSKNCIILVRWGISVFLGSRKPMCSSLLEDTILDKICTKFQPPLPFKPMMWKWHMLVFTQHHPWFGSWKGFAFCIVVDSTHSVFMCLLDKLTYFFTFSLCAFFQLIITFVILLLVSPVSPDMMDWRAVFPAFYPGKIEANGNSDRTVPKVEFADIGCGYGGLLGRITTLKVTEMMMSMILIFVRSFYCYMEWIFEVTVYNFIWSFALQLIYHQCFQTL